MDVSMELEQYYDFWIGMNGIYEKWAKMHNVTVNAIFTFYTIANSSDCSQRLIGEKLFLPKQTVNALLDSLIKNGYIDKKESTIDRRSKIIMLTEKGEVFANKILSELDIFETGALCKMTPQERKAMITNSQIYFNHLSDGLNDVSEKLKFDNIIK